MLISRSQKAQKSQKSQKQNRASGWAQEEAQEYEQETKLRELVTQYSEFINFPIYLWTTKQARPFMAPAPPLTPLAASPAHHLSLLLPHKTLR